MLQYLYRYKSTIVTLILKFIFQKPMRPYFSPNKIHIMTISLSVNFIGVINTVKFPLQTDEQNICDVNNFYDKNINY